MAHDHAQQHGQDHDHGHGAHAHGHGTLPGRQPLRLSLLRLSALQRMGGVAALLALLWAAVWRVLA